MRRTWLGLLICCTVTATAAAQWQFTGDAGAARLQQTAIPASNALTAGIAAERLGDRGWLRSSALVVVADSNRATAQALLTGSVLGAPDRRARWELSGALSGFGQTNGRPTTSGEGMARVRFDLHDRGATFGVGLGAAGHGGDVSGLLHGQADAYYVARDDQWVASLSAVTLPQMVTQHVTINGSSLVLTSERGVAYGDGTIGWRRELGKVSLGATGGVRAGVRGATSTGGWGTADAAFWLSERSALVIGVGRTLDDAVRGVPRTTYATVALRFAARPLFTRKRAAETPGAKLIAFAIDGGRRRIEVRGVEGSSVEMMGDFTDWQPVELERIGDLWRADRVISAGLHRIVLRVNGGEWRSPVNLPRETDDLGGVVGLITIP